MIRQYNLRNELINNRKDAKRFWSLLKSVSITRKDTTLSVCKLYEHFKQLLNNDLTNVDLDSSFLHTIRINPGCDELNNQITQQEIIQSVKTFKSNKSPGPDGICMEMYKNTLNDILPFLHKLFNDIFDTSSFPDDWSRSIITPLHKKGSVSNPDNYRGISLIDSICKIFMHILSSRLSNWCEHYHVIDESQAGCRKGYSTVDNIFILTSLIQKYLSKKRGRFFCIFIDFKKAFDSIRHDKLWDALERKGIKGKFLDTIKSMYKKLKSCVKTDGNLTPYFDCSIGTRQGCVASPKIFSLFINDLVDYLNIKNERGIFVTQDINELNVLMFADDVSSFADTVVQLQRQINRIEQFTKGVGLEINLEKTKNMVFRNGGVVKKTEKWFYNNNMIEIVPFYKYLGVYLTSRMTWSKTHLMLSLQSQKIINYIFRLRKHFGIISTTDMFKIFDATVKPVLCYGSQLWRYQCIEKIEKIHVQFCKRLCFSSQNTCDVLALGECGRLPLCTTYIPNCVKYWLSIIRMNNIRYPKQCYYVIANR